MYIFHLSSVPTNSVLFGKMRKVHCCCRGVSSGDCLRNDQAFLGKHWHLVSRDSQRSSKRAQRSSKRAQWASHTLSDLPLRALCSGDAIPDILKALPLKRLGHKMTIFFDGLKDQACTLCTCGRSHGAIVYIFEESILNLCKKFDT